METKEDVSLIMNIRDVARSIQMGAFNKLCRHEIRNKRKKNCYIVNIAEVS